MALPDESTYIGELDPPGQQYRPPPVVEPEWQRLAREHLATTPGDLADPYSRTAGEAVLGGAKRAYGAVSGAIDGFANRFGSAIGGATGVGVTAPTPVTPTPAAPGAPAAAPPPVVEPEWQRLAREHLASTGGGVPPAQMVPGGWQPGGHEVKIGHGIPVPEEARQANEVRTRALVSAAEKESLIASEAGKAEADFTAARAKALEAHAFAQDRLNRERDAAVATQMAKLESLSQERQSARVDPDAYFKERGTGGAILATIGAAFGGLYQGIRGGENPFLVQMNKAIDRNIQAQEANLSRMDRGIDQQRSLLATNIDMFGSREKGLLATKIQYLDQVQNQLDQRRALLKTPEAEVAYLKTTATIAGERAKAANDFQKQSYDTVTEAMDERYRSAHMVDGAPAGKAQDPALFVPTLGGYARDEITARKLNEQGSQRMQLDANIANALALKKEAYETYSPIRKLEIHKLLNSLAADSDTKKTVLEGQGAMSKGDKENTEESIGAMRGVIAALGGMQTDIKTLERSQERNLEHHRLAGEAYGVKRGTSVYVDTPTGPDERAVLKGQNRMPSGPTIGVDDKIRPIGSFMPAKRPEPTAVERAQAMAQEHLATKKKKAAK